MRFFFSFQGLLCTLAASNLVDVQHNVIHHFRLGTPSTFTQGSPGNSLDHQGILS